MSRFYDIRVCDSAIGEDNDVYAKSAQGRATRYKVGIFLDGRDLPYVYAATYRLHSTFDGQIWTVKRRPSNPSCRLTIWTWGVFTVQADVELKSGDVVRMRHRLTYDRSFQHVRRDLNQPILPDGSARYIYEPPQEGLSA